MGRPSRNLDRALLAAGRRLFPERGCAGLAVREVAQAAGVNLGMFHYHFRSREAFVRAVMQQAYEEMFASLALELDARAGTLAALRAAMAVLGHFVRDNRAFVARILADAMGGEACAREFLKENVPRHLEVLRALVERGQREGVLLPLAMPQALAICAGSVLAPIVFAAAAGGAGGVGRARARGLEAALLTDAAIAERIARAIAAISAPGARARRTPGRREAA